MHASVALIVDDEEDICRLLAANLRRKFLRVEYALTLKEGLLLAEALCPDWLILDNNLPDGIGIQLIHEFRKSSKKILVISAMNNLSEQALNAGADYFLSKPVSFADITELLEKSV